MKPVENAVTAVGGATCMGRTKRLVKSSIPPVSSRSEIKTVTPHTIMITRHGMIVTALSSSPARSKLSKTAPANAPRPTWTSKKMTPPINVVDHAQGDQMMAPEAHIGGSSIAARDPARGHDDRFGLVAAEQAPAAEQEVGAEGDHRVGHHVV